jgi:hypothetical protein
MKIEICFVANFHLHIPPKAEYFTRARREFHFCEAKNCEAKISHFARAKYFMFLGAVAWQQPLGYDFKLSEQYPA